MILLLLLAFPVLGALILRFAGDQKTAGTIATGVSAVSALASIFLYINFSPQGGFQHEYSLAWIPELGISFHIGIDGLSLAMVLLTNLLTPLILLSSFNNQIKSYKTFYGLILLMQFALTGVFTALDGFLFYVFWELALIPIWFICLLWGGKERVKITLRFFIYTLSGSLLMLLGLIYLVIQMPGDSASFSLQDIYTVQLNPEQQSWLFWAFFLAFAIKIPVFPFHSWQPDTYTDSPVQGTMILSGIMLKMGLYGILRWMLPVIPVGVEEWGSTAAALAVAGIVYASLMAMAQSDFKRLIAYSSIAHVGVIAAAIFTLNIEALQGSVFQMVSHGVNVIGIFLVADILERYTGTRNMNAQGGLVTDSRLFAVTFMIILLGSVALPLTNGFVGEFLMLTGLFKYSASLTMFAGLTVVLGAVYMLRSYQKIMLGDRHIEKSKSITLSTSESVILVLVGLVILVMGVFPEGLLKLTEPAVMDIIKLSQLK